MFSSFKIENDYIYVQLKGILSTEDQFNGFIKWLDEMLQSSKAFLLSVRYSRGKVYHREPQTFYMSIKVHFRFKI